MDPGQILLGAGLVLVVLYVLGRRKPSSASPGGQVRGRNGARPARPSLTRLDEVVPIPAPLGWPVLPEEPPGLDGEPEERTRVALADRPYTRTTCPSCEVALEPLPKAKRRCSGCGNEIFVRSGPDGRRYLLTELELETFQEQWAADASQRYVEAAARQKVALGEWHERLRGVGLAVGGRDLDVVGESYYHAALAGIRAGLNASPHRFELRAAAALVREPDNAYDKNSIAVFIHGVQVGHLDRYDAEEYQGILKRRGDRMWVQAVVMGGRPTPFGEVGPIGVKLDDIPGPGE
jgi:hypothetical protein